MSRTPLPPQKKRSILAPLTFPNVKNPPPPPKKAVDFGTVDLPECQEAPSPHPKKKSILAPLTFPNVKNNAGKHKSTRRSVFFRRRRRPLAGDAFTKKKKQKKTQRKNLCQNRPFSGGEGGSDLKLAYTQGEACRSGIRQSSTRSHPDGNAAAQSAPIASPDTRGQSGCCTSEDCPHQSVHRSPWKGRSRGGRSVEESVGQGAEPGQDPSSGNSDCSSRAIYREGEEEIGGGRRENPESRRGVATGRIGESCGHPGHRRCRGSSAAPQRSEFNSPGTVSTTGQFVRSAAAARAGDPVDGTTRQSEGQSNQASRGTCTETFWSPRRLRPALRRGNAGVDGGASLGPPFGHGIWPTLGSGKDLTTCDGSCSGLADRQTCPTTRSLCERLLARVDLPRIKCCAGGGTPVWLPRMSCGRSS